MKPLFNAGIIYKELKNTKIILFLMLLCIFLFKSMQIYNITTRTNIKYYYDIFHYVLLYKDIQAYGFVIIMSILIILLTYFQMSYDKKSSCSITYMIPVEKGTIIINKLIIALVYIFTAFFINTILIFLTILLNNQFYNDVGLISLLQWFVRSVFSYFVMYLIFMLFQVLTVNNIESIILGLLFVNIPKGITLFINWLDSNYLIKIPGKYNIESIIYSIWQPNYIINPKLDIYSLLSYDSAFTPLNDLSVYRERFIQYNYEPYWGFKIIILLLTMITFSLLIIYFFNKSSLEIQQKQMLTKNIFIQAFALIILGISFIALIMRFENGIFQNFYENPILLVSIITVLSIYVSISVFVARNIVKAISKK